MYTIKLLSVLRSRAVLAIAHLNAYRTASSYGTGIWNLVFLQRRLLHHSSSSMSASNAFKPDYTDGANYNMREDLLTFNEGNVYLDKNEQNGIATITFCHPEKKNAITGKMLVELSDIINDLELWSEGKAILFQTPGDCFCSGMDLAMIKAKSDQQGGRIMADYFENVIYRLHRLPLITVVAIQGKAIGGGAELTTGFDFRIMSPLAEIRFVQVNMGVTTGIVGGGTRLARLVGESKALEILLSGDRIDSKTALSIGLASHVFSGEQPFKEEVDVWLNDLLRNKEMSLVRSMKEIVRNATLMTLEKAFIKEKDIFVDNWGKKTLLEALRDRKKHV